MKMQVKNPALANSRFMFDQVLFLDINFHKLNLTRGSSYLPLPGWILSKKVVINLKDEEDEECFKGSIIAALHHEVIGKRKSKLRRFEDDYDWRGLEFLIALDKIKVFKRNNVSVNVLTIRGGKEKLYILRKAKLDSHRKMANLLLIDGEGKKHYATIENLSQLLGSSNSSDRHQQHFCLNCLQGFPSKESRNKHFKYCVDHEAVRIDMPQENSFVRFHSGQYQFKVPFIIYTNFQAILQSLEHETKIDSKAQYTREINHCVSSGVCTYTTFAYRKVDNLLRLYQGKDCVEVFCDHIEEEAERLYHMFPPKPMEPLMPEQWREFSRARKCHICLECVEPWDTIVRDHCH